MTLNQIVKRLKSLALAHKQINHFYFGDMVQWLTNGDVVYPAVFTDLPTAEISRGDKQTFFDFEIWFCDLSNVAESTRENELEVQSDLTSIAEDYKAMMEFSGYSIDWTVSESAPLAYYEEKFLEDLVISIKMTLRIGIRNDSNRCIVPVDSLPFEPEKDAMIVTNYIYEGLGTEANTITLPVLQNKTVLMLFKGDKLLKKAQGSPSENEYTFNPQTAVFVFGTDIEQGQILQILNR